jgi:ABC-type oligopeptide transport system substrate-binding subunit
MLRRDFEPENIVFVGPETNHAVIKEDALVILGSPVPPLEYLSEFSSPEERYQNFHTGLMEKIIAARMQSVTLPDRLEKKHIQNSDPELWDRYQRAATRILAENGYIKPLHHQTIRSASTIIADMPEQPWNSGFDQTAHFIDQAA